MEEEQGKRLITIALLFQRGRKRVSSLSFLGLWFVTFVVYSLATLSMAAYI